MIKLFRFYVLLLILVVSALPVYSQTYFSARLTELQIPGSGSDSMSVTQNNSAFAGTAVFYLNSATNTGGQANNDLRFIITIGSTTAQDTTGGGGDTTGNTSAALREIHFHLGAIGDTGQVIHSITQGIRGNSFSGTWTSGDAEPLTDEIRREMVKGNVYIVAVTDSVHIRGQIHPASGTGFVSHLTGPQRPDSVATRASGVGSFLLTDIGLVYLISVQGLDLTSASISKGMPGVDGPALWTVDFNGHTAFGFWPTTDTLNRPTKMALLAEELYVNVASSAYPNGEIRGQILHAGGFGFSSPLMSTSQTDTTGGQNDTTQQRGPVGNASYTLTDHGLVFHIVLDTRGEDANLFFQNEVTGEMVKDVFDFKDETFSSVWLTYDDPTPLRDQHIADLLQGRLSLVVAMANDTLRGRIMPHKQTNFTALLTGFQERPRVMSQASGVGHFILTDTGLRYHIVVEGIDTIVGAHFHMAPVGVNGGVVQPITFDSTFHASGEWSRTGGDNMLTEDMIDAILRGEIYVNVHTPQNPQGEIRGQLVPASGTDFKAHLTSRQMNPAGQAAATGTGNFILANEGLVYKLSIDSLAIAGIDFVRGELGETGTVINSITPSTDTSGNTIIGVWRRTGGQGQALSDTLINALLTGDIYVSVRTADNPNGAVRGQVLPNGGWGFVSTFSPQGGETAFENANGTAIYTLTDAGLKYHVTAEGFTGNSAGIYAGQAGTPSGNLVQQLTGSFTGTTSKGAWVMLNDSASAMANLPLLFSEGLFLQLQTTDTTEFGRFSAQITREFGTPVVSVERDNSAPRSFSLEQNYPNPFNPSTTIRFSIPQDGDVNLTVFNVIGEKVATLVDGQNYKAGNYQISFDGSRLASGVYFYRLNYSGNMTTKKMLLIK